MPLCEVAYLFLKISKHPKPKEIHNKQNIFFHLHDESISTIPDEYRNDPVAVAECWAGSITKAEYMKVLEQAGFKSIEIIEESAPYLKGKAEVASFTIAGTKNNACSCNS